MTREPAFFELLGPSRSPLAPPAFELGLSRWQGSRTAITVLNQHQLTLRFPCASVPPEGRDLVESPSDSRLIEASYDDAGLRRLSHMSGLAKPGAYPMPPIERLIIHSADSDRPWRYPWHLLYEATMFFDWPDGLSPYLLDLFNLMTRFVVDNPRKGFAEPLVSRVSAINIESFYRVAADVGQAISLLTGIPTSRQAHLGSYSAWWAGQTGAVARRAAPEHRLVLDRLIHGSV